LEHTCRLSHLSVGLSVCLSVGLEAELWKNGYWIWIPLGVVSGVGRGMGGLDGNGDRRKEKGNFGGKYGASHYKTMGDFVA